MLTVKVEPLEKDIELTFKKNLSPQARSHILAEFARETLAEAEQINTEALGHLPPHETFVDGMPGASEDRVRPDGTIIYEFNILEDLFAWIGEQLVTHSPVLTGRYAASHKFFADGVEVDPGAPAPAASQYQFVNSQPYARKIEHGLSPQAPDGVYQGVAALASRRFGNVAKIRFTYLSEAGSKERQPAIVITL